MSLAAYMRYLWPSLQRHTDENLTTPARSSPVPEPSSPGLSSDAGPAPDTTTSTATKPCSRCKLPIPADFQYKQCDPCRARGREEMRRHNERVKERRSLLAEGEELVDLRYKLVPAPDIADEDELVDVRRIRAAPPCPLTRICRQRPQLSTSLRRRCTRRSSSRRSGSRARCVFTPAMLPSPPRACPPPAELTSRTAS
jgi:hypothetical protein